MQKNGTYNEVYMALEISEYAIKAVVAEYFDNKTFVLASLEKNVVYDCDQDEVDSVVIKDKLIEIKKELSALIGYDIKNTILVIPSNNCQKISTKQRVYAINSHQIIEKAEINKGVSELIKQHDDKDNFVVNVVIDKYSAYGYGYVSNPIGLETRYIELEASVYSIPSVVAYPLIKIVEDAGFNIANVCLDIIAIGQESIPTTAFKNGCVIVDLSYENTNIAYFKKNTLSSYTTINLGGKHITNDIALCAKIDVNKAEVFKKKYVNLAFEDSEDLVIYSYYDEINNENVDISQKLISEIALSRVEEIVELVNNELNNIQVEDGEIIYFSGGANKINGLKTVLNEKLNYPFQICAGNNLGARDSTFINCLGAIKQEIIFSRTIGEVKLFVNQKEYIESINLVEKNKLLYNSIDKSENEFIYRLVSYIFNN